MNEEPKFFFLVIYPLTLNIWDMMRCIDYLEAKPEVNPERI
jgi:hypothetical protein